MTMGFADLDIGDSVQLKGPIGHFTWQGNGTAIIHGKAQTVQEIGMVCGGSGITPILQVLRGILHDKSREDIKIWVLDTNRYFDDILCREELHQLLEGHKERLHLHFTLTGTVIPSGWEYSVGHINDNMLRCYLPSPAGDKLVCICGPPAMEQSTQGAGVFCFCWRALFISCHRCSRKNGVESIKADRRILVCSYELVYL
jgi:nitrate reductase (NAD(P)H)